MKQTLRHIVTASLVAATTSAAAADYSRLITFGDSFSDTGNLVGALMTQPYEQVLEWWPPFAVPGYANGFFEGRPTNGLSMVEHLAARLDLPLNNYAWTGALSGHGNVLPFVNTAIGATGVADQIDGHLATNGGADPDALYVVWGGHNDFWGLGQFLPNSIDDASRLSALALAGQQAANDIAANVDALIDAGARNITVLNSISLEYEPFWEPLYADDPALRGLLHGGVDAMNTRLNSLLDVIAGENMGVSLVRFDAQVWYEDTIASVLAGHQPGGLTDAGSACFAFDGAAFAACGDPDEYFFWDSIHLTTQAYSMLAEGVAGALAAPVPEPATALLFPAGLALILMLRRRTAPLPVA